MSGKPTGERQRAVEALERRLGHAFADKALLEEALTHSSLIGQGKPKVRHSQRLEFLGDRVLGLVMADELVKLYPEEREGDLTKRFHALVDKRACADVARKLDVGPALRLPGAVSKRGGRNQDSLLGDACEALLAAVYLDAGLEAAREVVVREWAQALREMPPALMINPKSVLHEWALARAKTPPHYAMVAREGPEHAPTFTVEAQVEGYAPACGAGGSRRAAEKAAAAALLERETAL